jgi:SSS family solute:Na+ symporter
MTVQRLMAVRTYRGMIKAVIFNSYTDFFIIALLLFVGIGLYAYYQAFPGQLLEGLSSDRILPYYIMHELPNGVSGLIIAAIFAAAMSSMDSSLRTVTQGIHPLGPRPTRRAG